MSPRALSILDTAILGRMVSFGRLAICLLRCVSPPRPGNNRPQDTHPAPHRVASMIVFVLAYLGGVLTIISPCILPVLPFVFARADQPFRKSGLPLLAGMAVTFAGVAAVAVV